VTAQAVTGRRVKARRYLSKTACTERFDGAKTPQAVDEVPEALVFPRVLVVPMLRTGD